MVQLHNLKDPAGRQALGEEMRMWRVRNGYNQREAGELMGVSRYTVIRIENGQKVGWVAAYKCFAVLAAQLREEAEAK